MGFFVPGVLRSWGSPTQFHIEVHEVGEETTLLIPAARVGDIEPLARVRFRVLLITGLGGNTRVDIDDIEKIVEEQTISVGLRTGEGNADDGRTVSLASLAGGFIEGCRYSGTLLQRDDNQYVIEMAGDTRWLQVEEEQTGALLPPVDVTFEVKVVGTTAVFGNLVKPYNLREAGDPGDLQSNSSGCFHDTASQGVQEEEQEDETLDGLLEHLQEHHYIDDD